MVAKAAVVFEACNQVSDLRSGGAGIQNDWLVVRLGGQEGDAGIPFGSQAHRSPGGGVLFLW